MSRTTWTFARDEELRRLWATGMSTRLIAEAMGLNKNQVIGRAHRLQLPARLSPLTRRSARAEGAAQPARNAQIRKPQAKAAAPKHARPTSANRMPASSSSAGSAEAQAASAHLPPAAQGMPQPGVFLASSGCRWPMWGDRERPTHRYCDQPVRLRADGSRCVYCAQHAARAFAAQPERDPAQRVARSIFAWGGPS